MPGRRSPSNVHGSGPQGNRAPFCLPNWKPSAIMTTQAVLLRRGPACFTINASACSSHSHRGGRMNMADHPRNLRRPIAAVAGIAALGLAAACTPGGGNGDDDGDGPIELVWALGGAEAQPGG